MKDIHIIDLNSLLHLEHQDMHIIFSNIVLNLGRKKKKTIKLIDVVGLNCYFRNL